ncbi:hypothetical protein Dda_9008 [Drechslerella dactyloides]|uniref:DUF747-domain-containing protein n=1 Tax=Drechslerella dactyloides TaxID=74499 RepID=A0AAD6IPR4_DREDA|nr:hypothetical protein Dda_9008 [Drechslerella dactyloides]
MFSPLISQVALAVKSHSQSGASAELRAPATTDSSSLAGTAVELRDGLQDDATHSRDPEHKKHTTTSAVTNHNRHGRGTLKPPSSNAERCVACAPRLILEVQDTESPTSKGRGEPSLLPPPDFLIPDAHDDANLQLPKWQAPSHTDESKTNSTAVTTATTSPVLSEREDVNVPRLSPGIPSGLSLQAITIPEDHWLKADGKLSTTASSVDEVPLSPQIAKFTPDTLSHDGSVSSRRPRSGSTTSKGGRSRAGSLTKDDASKEREKQLAALLQRPPLPPLRNHSGTANVRRAKSGQRVGLNGSTYIGANLTPLVPPSSSAKHTEKANPTSSGPASAVAEPRHSRDTIATTPISLGDYLYLSLSTTPASKYDLVSAELRIEKLMNFLTLPMYLEGALWFGSFACLDGWLWNFTILPIRFAAALWRLLLYWMKLIGEIVAYLAKSWLRPEAVQLEAQRKTSDDQSQQTQTSSSGADSKKDSKRRRLAALAKRRKTSDLQPNHKADLLKGAVVIFSCWILMEFDASRMYHSIRGQNAIKLYVIYSVLEVADKLLSAIGQDIFECLFSRESLERRPDGTSKVLRPFGFFLLALGYNVLHATALFYQVITLNVAVNSYSNSLITLLLSNQFVEIKTTVFKRIEKENLFQMACADVVERFQLWLMLIIIASRNLVEIGLDGLLGVGGFGLTGLVSAAGLGFPSPLGANAPNTSTTSSSGGMFLPKSFTILPKWTGQLMGPFLLVLGSEMFVDWLKHAYITKFNNIKPQIYSRYLDVLAKDYYTHAFAEENLMRRLGLPVIPLACLFIRSSLQTYQMFISTHFPSPSFGDSTATTNSAASLGKLHTGSSSPATTAALHEFDSTLRRVFSSSTGDSAVDLLNTITEYLTIATIFIGIWLVFLVFKFVLGMGLLAVARRRYKGMKEREKAGYAVPGVSTGGVAEMNEDKKRIINGGEAGGGAVRKTTPLGEVERFDMVAKRIW